ncbi:hypothetical protein MNBD_NITROSPINAE02-993 [hydrothermal vent metagenome]|uniref:NAD(P)-binding domain-containing protein n=1 Tax=hydrothermal vent metagenome TaxID=652676 RepID=A0A3B1C9I3_9ZZZZ
MKVFITGGTGFVGRNILGALRREGHSIRALVRAGSEARLPYLEGIEVVYGDVTLPADWSGKLRGIDAVIHLVGIIREFPGQNITFEKIHFEGTGAMVEAAKQGGVKRFIHMSANGASSDGASEYQTTKYRAEELVKNSGMEWTIFRPSVIFGESDGLMEFTSELGGVIAFAPVMPVFGDGKYELEPVAIENVAECFVKALSEGAAVNKTFHLGCGSPASYNDVIQTIGKAVGKVRTKTVNVPLGLVEPVARIMGRFRFFPVTADQIRMLKGGNVCPEHDFMEVFSIEPKKFIYQNLKYLGKFKRKKR